VAQARGRVDIREATRSQLMGSISGSTHLDIRIEGGRYQDRPTSISEPMGVNIRIDPPQYQNRWGSISGTTHLNIRTDGGRYQDRPTSISGSMGVNIRTATCR
jgi:hypothetical protein